MSFSAVMLLRRATATPLAVLTLLLALSCATVGSHPDARRDGTDPQLAGPADACPEGDRRTSIPLTCASMATNRSLCNETCGCGWCAANSSCHRIDGTEDGRGECGSPLETQHPNGCGMVDEDVVAGEIVGLSAIGTLVLSWMGFGAAFLCCIWVGLYPYGRQQHGEADRDRLAMELEEGEGGDRGEGDDDDRGGLPECNDGGGEEGDGGEAEGHDIRRYEVMHEPDADVEEITVVGRETKY